MVKYRDAELVFQAFGVPIRRQMVARLARMGAMSVSKMSEPFGITLPGAMKHLRIMEKSRIVTTHKQGRVRICVFNRKAFRAFATALADRDFL